MSDESSKSQQLSRQQKLEQLVDLLTRRDESLSLAESCTGGLLSSWITERAGVSKFFCGSVVSYAAHLKEDLLKVSPQAIRAYGEVSLPVARQMAHGARQVMSSHWAVSITGVAGPTGGSPEKPVGTVCFAVSGPGFEEVRQQYFELGDRVKIQSAAANYALEFLIASLQR